MLSLKPASHVYLAAGATDLRKFIDGLSIMVQMSFKLDPFEDSIFVFCNNQKDKLKILFWDKNGFWLYYRRLERGRFKWPGVEDGSKTIHVTERELSWLLDGLDISQPRAHRTVKQRTLI